jgi:GntR family transcriptional regulator/MocR family aminotransferase
MNIIIDRTSKENLTTQIYNYIKRAIHMGDISGGYKLPSTRELSRDLQISRNTVIEAYEQLLTEGYLYTKPGSGYYSSEKVTLNQNRIDPPLDVKEISMEKDSSVIDFKTGIPNLNNIPTKVLGNISREVYQDISQEDLGYSLPQGVKELREEIAKYTAIYRGVKAHPDQIVITSGTTQAIGLVTKILKKSVSPIALEEPITKDIREIIHSNNGSILSIPVDESGLIVSRLKKLNFKAVYTTPSHQYPLGSTMSLERRVELIKLCQDKTTYIIEDDYDSEFRYDGKPIPSLQGLAPDRVIYIGTFSKTLFPSLRIAYMILPFELISIIRQEKWLVDLHNPVVDQLTLSRFINRGHYRRLISKQKKVYRRRREHLLYEINRLFTIPCHIFGTPTGMHLAVRFKGINFNKKLLKRIYNSGVKIYRVEEHCYIKGNYRDTVILGYGSLTRNEITKGLEALKLVINP